MHPYRSPATGHEARPQTRERSLGLALGVLVVVSLIQVVTAYRHAGALAVQTLTGAACLAAGVMGLQKQR